ncbi:hypothetical protein NCCP2716_25760 [Sporosarcina sp. NCCP-2716]|uniref:hypothetical protein n=1 Tax=Sporosarcina sp. NCCP-2716 TaxID=2943679 RepID=UPI00203A6EAD|nr:hypothetical protein [Sporosarcina sp. NCCP-2716]GKV70078.1 hypothetical protein NCCP2716_25760 [Sporosarcina sp. NCCP-2716]
MRLPKYITGFLDEEAVLNPMDGAYFKKSGNEIVRKLQYDVTHFSLPEYSINFFRFGFRKDGKEFAILLHEYFPYAALAAYDSELNTHFIDCDGVTAELSPYYQVLDAEFLNGAFDPAAHDLAEIELTQVRYWKIVTIGEVVFNCWD